MDYPPDTTGTSSGPGVPTGQDRAPFVMMAYVIALPTRSGKPDAVLAKAADLARGAVLEVADAAEVGDHLGALAEGERVVTHHFACTRPGYPGWH